MLPSVIFVLQLYYVKCQAINWENNACHHFRNYPLKFLSKDCFKNDNVKVPTPAMIERNGFKLETHPVITDDGYGLQLFRIPPDQNDYRKNKQPVVLEHGIFADSGVWVFVGNRSIALHLAAQGYDVWLTNQRGTKYSLAHIKLEISNYKYWTYTTDDVAANDVPATLHKIADVTGKAGQIIYIGHSRGSTVGFMFAAQFPETAEELLRGMVALSPIAYLDLVWYIKPFATLCNYIGGALFTLRIPAFFYTIKPINDFFQVFCSFFPLACKFFVEVSSGPTQQFLPMDLLALFSHWPTSLAITQLIQYGQISNSGKFQKYDYGEKKNVEIYGQNEPPVYNLSNINIPVFLLYGNHDVFIKAKTVAKLYNELGGGIRKGCSSVLLNMTGDYQFDHNDFLWSKYLDTFYNQQLVPILDELQ